MPTLVVVDNKQRPNGDCDAEAIDDPTRDDDDCDEEQLPPRQPPPSSSKPTTNNTATSSASTSQQKQSQQGGDDDGDTDCGGIGIGGDDDQRRVVLLLDLDCFYAQCECVRLGLDAATTPLALLQWNSVLAVTYPARNLYHIKRGDSWEVVSQKSNGRCLAVHVPVLTTASAAAAATATAGETETETANNRAEESTSTSPSPDDLGRPTGAGASEENNNNSGSGGALADEYGSIFSLDAAAQQVARTRELGVRRFSREGKSCIERYRIASGRIFEAVRGWIRTHGGGGGGGTIVLERASIDEFFLDVTAAAACGGCDRDNNDDDACTDRPLFNNKSSGSSKLNEEDRDEEAGGLVDFERTKTVVIGEEEERQQDDGEDGGKRSEKTELVAPKQHHDQQHVQALRQGCRMAFAIRECVRRTLGFTLSAGIGPNKTVAKLSTTYGKPDGQAVVFPHHVPCLLNETQISKCRNLGGKLGARVQALLPQGVPTTVGSIARYLSLVDLQRGLGSISNEDGTSSSASGGDAAARWVFHLARGMDDELVAAKTDSEALVKSITAFKSLNRRPHSLEKCDEWIRLLAVEIVTRVERDSKRHSRYPRQCSVQYHNVCGGNGSNKSVRTNFPPERLSTQDKIRHIVEAVPKLIRGKEGASVRVDRIGLCAGDFVTRAGRGQAIDSFFALAAAASNTSNTAASYKGDTDPTTSERAEKSKEKECPKQKKRSEKETTDIIDVDLDLAKRLQKTYDGENRIAQAVDEAETRARGRRRQRQEPATRISQQQQQAVPEQEPSQTVIVVEDEEEEDPDMALAKRLQADYDREQRVLQGFDQGQQVARTATSRPHQPRAPKNRRIDTFFQKR